MKGVEIMEKPELKSVKKATRELNKLGILEEKIDPKQDIDELIKAYMIGIMRLSDLGKEDKINDNMLSVYNHCRDYMESLDNSFDDGNGEFDREAMEDKLSDMDEDDLQEFIDNNDLEVEVDEDDLESTVEEILDAMEEKAENASGDDSKPDDSEEDHALRKVLEVMSAKEVKAFIKENNIDIKIKAKDWKDTEENKKLIAKIIELSEPKKDDNSKIREELYKMSAKEVKAFLKEKSIDIKIKAKDWKDVDKKTKLVIEIAEKLEGSTDTKKLPESREDREEMLQGMNWTETMQFITDYDLTDNVDCDIEEDDFEDEQEDLIEEILDELEDRDSEKPKVTSTSASKPKPANAPKKAGAKRKTGNTVQEIISRVIKNSGKALTKKEIIAQATKVREDAGESTTSIPNFTNIVLLTGQALGVIKHDASKDTYVLK